MLRVALDRISKDIAVKNPNPVERDNSYGYDGFLDQYIIEENPEFARVSAEIARLEGRPCGRNRIALMRWEKLYPLVAKVDSNLQSGKKRD